MNVIVLPSQPIELRAASNQAGTRGGWHYALQVLHCRSQRTPPHPPIPGSRTPESRVLNPGGRKLVGSLNPLCGSRFSAAASSPACTAGTCVVAGRDRRAATRAATREGRGVLPRVRRHRAATRDYAAAIDDPRVDAVVVAVPPRVSPGPDAAGARRRQARARREAGVPAHGGLRDGASRRATGPDASCSSARTITTSRWRCGCGGCWPTARSARWCSRTSRPSPSKLEDRRRLAQRRDDGRRRRVLRGRHPLAAPGGQPRAHGSSTIARLSAAACRATGRTGAPRA